MSYVKVSDDQDDLLMEFESGSDDGLSDSDTGVSDSEDETNVSDDDPGEVGEVTGVEDEQPGGAPEANAAGEIGEGPVEAVGPGPGDWEYEPLPHGMPGDNVGDAGPMPDENRLHNLDW